MSKTAWLVWLRLGSFLGWSPTDRQEWVLTGQTGSTWRKLGTDAQTLTDCLRPLRVLGFESHTASAWPWSSALRWEGTLSRLHEVKSPFVAAEHTHPRFCIKHSMYMNSSYMHSQAWNTKHKPTRAIYTKWYQIAHLNINTVKPLNNAWANNRHNIHTNGKLISPGNIGSTSLNID